MLIYKQHWGLSFKMVTNTNYVEKKYHAMGGVFIMKCFAQSRFKIVEVEKIFNMAFSEIKRIEAKFSEFNPSLVTEINNDSGLRATTIDNETLFLLNKSNQFAKRSAGTFDITFASLAIEWRKAKEEGRVLSDEFRYELAKQINYKQLQIDSEKMTIYLPSKLLKISFGGIGKGYAVDRAYEILKIEGLENFYINGAGDIRVHSNKDAPRPWRIGVTNPFAPEKHAGVIQLANGAVATSGSYIQKIINKDEKLDHHIVSPVTGRSVDSIISATIISDFAMESDTTATIVMNMNEKDALKYLNNNKLYGCLINKNGKTLLSKTALNNFNL